MPKAEGWTKHSLTNIRLDLKRRCSRSEVSLNSTIKVARDDAFFPQRVLPVQRTKTYLWRLARMRALLGVQMRQHGCLTLLGYIE